MPLDTLSNIKVGLAVSDAADDTLLTRLQASADAFVAEHCGRDFAGGTFTEFHPGGGRLLFLANYPVASVTSVIVDATREFDPGTTLDADDYIVHAGRGVIESAADAFVRSLQGDGRPDRYPRTVKVTYTTTTTVPALVKQAYTDLIGHWFRQAKTHAGTGQLNLQEKPTADGQTVYPWGQSGGFRVPNGVLELLQPYRLPTV